MDKKMWKKSNMNNNYLFCEVIQYKIREFATSW